MSRVSLSALADAVASLIDPRSKQGVSHPYHGMLVLVLIGLIAQIPYISRIQRWSKKHWSTLRDPLNFKRNSPPHATTLARALAKTSVADFQRAFAEFLKIILADDHNFIAAAVDGKVAKQMKNADGDPILMLNIFAHNIKVTLLSYDVKGDKTNEPSCLKMHLEELFTMYPFLKLLTGDAIFAQRPLLEALQEYECDYLFQVKANQPEILDATKVCFADVDPEKPDYKSDLEKKTAKSNSVRFGATASMPSMFESV
jgi:hypothetical protein